MQHQPLTRRAMLHSVSAAACGLLGLNGCQPPASRAVSTGNDFEPAKKISVPDRIIDVHVHLVDSNLPGSAEMYAPDDNELKGSVEEVAERIRAQLKSAGVEHALCMPRREKNPEDPLGIEASRRFARIIPGLHLIGLADPERFDKEHLALVEEVLKRGDVVAFKAYLGYLYYGPDAEGYHPYYDLAARYDIPVIFHTGDTYSHLAKVRYAHPLPVDDVAVDFPKTKFVLAHMGNPWLMDAAELIYKNNKRGVRENVWADLSGLIVGSAAEVEQWRRDGSLQMVIDDVRKAIGFTERMDRILFGSDWPLAPIQVYRDLVAEIVDPEHHQAVFYDNAKALFKL